MGTRGLKYQDGQYFLHKFIFFMVKTIQGFNDIMVSMCVQLLDILIQYHTHRKSTDLWKI